MTTAYPLAWPEGWPRMPANLRKPAQFSKKEWRTTSSSIPGQPSTSYQATKELSVMDSTKRVLDELGRFGVQFGDAIISTNLLLRLDGLPRSDQSQPDDPGVAVYWRNGPGPMKVMAIDRYTTVSGNLAAVAATLDAMRAIERHGGAQILERAFTGFTALPPPLNWRQIMGFTPTETVTRAQIELRHRSLAKVRHPDVQGGSAIAMAELNVAKDKALQEIQQ